jgi:allophanate hydrolase subunit 1
MQVAPAGDNAVLIELGEVTAEELHAAARAVEAVNGVMACIVGHSSLYVVFESSSLRVVESAIAAATSSGAPRPLEDSTTSRLRVSFDDAPDLAEFLERTSLTLDAFLARVATLRLTARYLGFRGGFAYLDGWPEEWAMPRRATSRPVRSGSFAIAGTMAGFYPIDSPGGWNILGRTDENLEHALRPGDVITIESTMEPCVVAPLPRAAVATLEGVDVISAPLMTIVHSPDYANLSRGLPPGGPFDDMAASLATRAVVDCRALLECAMTGPRLRFREEAVAAWCGPDLAVRVHRVRAGQELAIGRIDGGLRGYLAIGRGEGVVADVKRGERGDRHVIRAIRGPHDIGIDAIECEVTPRLDRVGVRLRPLREPRVEIPAGLRSCGMQCGTVQLHPDGSLVAMGPDHPVTGGYLQPMTVITTERWKLAQLMPGEKIKLLAIK